MNSPPLKTLPDTLPPLLRLPSELHLAIISFLPDLKDAQDEHDVPLLQLRQTNRYFHTLVPPPTHSDLLSLEITFYNYSVYACRFCLRLRPSTKFASSMLKGKTGINGSTRDKRFCADCGFDTTVVRRSKRYCPSTRVSVDGVDWVWCKYCKLIKKNEEAQSVCLGACKMCYDAAGCRCSVQCGKPRRSRTLGRLAEIELRHNRLAANDGESEGFIREYYRWKEQHELAQAQDDEWPSL